MTDSENFTHSNIRVVQQDVSNKALSMAREVDRLPPGNYCIVVCKPSLRGQPWNLTIEKTETVRRMDLDR